MPFSLIYSTNETNEMVEILSNLAQKCIDRHPPIKRTKVTCPPAPSLKDIGILSLRKQRNKLRYKANQEKTNEDWESFRKVRNRLKKNDQGNKAHVPKLGFVVEGTRRGNTNGSGGLLKNIRYHRL